MGSKRVRRFKPEPDEVAIDVSSEAEVTENEAAEIAKRFKRKQGRNFPRLVAALNAESEDNANNLT